MSAAERGLLGTGLRFGVVGVLTACIHYGVLFVGVAALGLGSTLASSVGFGLAVGFNYVVHYYWTFAAGSAPHGRALARYLAMISGGFVINGLLMQVATQGLHWHYLVAQALALVAVVTWNFTLANTWVFRG